MSTIGNSSGTLSVHTQISADIIGNNSGASNKKSSDKISRERDFKGASQEKKIRDNQKSAKSKSKKLNERQSTETQTTNVDREIEQKMLKDGSNTASGLNSQLQSQIQSKPGSLASMQFQGS